MEKLMLEMPSPNVTKMIPISVGKEFNDEFESCDFIVTPHQNGIFEFSLKRPLVNSWVYNQLKEAFIAYQNYIYNVGVTGVPNDPYANLTGSTRFCTMDYDFAEFLTKIIKYRSAVDVIRDQSGDWYEMINVSQYFRFMRYFAGGEHFPHYDSDFEYEYNKSITKYSVVTYFTDCKTGQLAFLNDKGTEFEGKMSDWTRQARDEEIYLKIAPAQLKIVVFPHTLCHTVLPYTEIGERIICRGDILYRKV